MENMQSQHTDAEIVKLIRLIEKSNQTNQEKYETVKPHFVSLNLHCDEFSLKLEKDADLFPIPLQSIGVMYEEESQVLFLLLKQSGNLHAFDIKNKLHITYMIQKRNNAPISFFINLYNKIRKKTGYTQE